MDVRDHRGGDPDDTGAQAVKMLGLMGALLAGLFLTHALIEAQARADLAKAPVRVVEDSQRVLAITTQQLHEAQKEIATLHARLATAQRTIDDTRDALEIRNGAIAFLVQQAEADMRRRQR